MADGVIILVHYKNPAAKHGHSRKLLKRRIPAGKKFERAQVMRAAGDFLHIVVETRTDGERLPRSHIVDNIGKIPWIAISQLEVTPTDVPEKSRPLIEFVYKP